MTVQPVQANVVLTSDNTQYDQAMTQSTTATDKLGASLDGLGAKMNNLAKSAGRKVFGLTMVDVGVITAATAAWAAYEKQMSGLQAQAAVISRTQDQQSRTMQNYTQSVHDLRTEYGATTTEAAQLTQQVSKLAGSGPQLDKLVQVFEKMGMATGESSSNLASSVLGLQKLMGTPIRADVTQKYADQLTYLAAKTDTTAGALADFTSQIAPMGRAMGMSQTQVTGFANMFIKAGQDGYTAATAFNKIAQDITYSLQSGSPDIRQYANLLGVTVKSFKDMTGAQQVAGFLDAITRSGPKAATILNQFGFDGIRMAKSITATVQASGGASNALKEAQIGFGSDATDKGAKAAESLINVLSRLRQTMQETAESFAKVLGPGVVIVLKGIEKVAEAFNSLMQGPLGKFAQVAAAILVPIGALTAAFLTMAGAIMKIGTAAALIRSGPGYGFVEGLRGGSRLVAERTESGLRTGGFIPVAGGAFGKRGAEIAAEEGGTWFQRSGYNVGNRAAQFARTPFMIPGAIRSGYNWANLRTGSMLPFWGEAGAEGLSPLTRLNMLGGKAITTVGGLASMSVEGLRYGNLADRTQVLGRHFPGFGPQLAEAQERSMAAEADLASKRAFLGQVQASRQPGYTGVAMPPGAEREATIRVQAAEKVAAAARKEEEAILASAATRTKDSEAEAADTKKDMGVAQASREQLVKFTVAITDATLELAKMGGAAAGAAIGAGAKAAGTGIMSRIAASGPIAAMGGPWGAGLMAAFTLPMLLPLIKQILPSDTYKTPTIGAPGAGYLRAAGMSVPTAPTATTQTSKSRTPTMAEATKISQDDISAANAPDYKFTDTALDGMNENEARTWASVYYGKYSNNPQAMAKLKLDLIRRFGATEAGKLMSQLGQKQVPLTTTPFYQAGRGADHPGINFERAARVVQAQSVRTYFSEGQKGRWRTQAQGLAGAMREMLTHPEAYGQDDISDAITQINKVYGTNISADYFNSMIARRLQGATLSPQGRRSYDAMVSGKTSAEDQFMTYFSQYASPEERQSMQRQFGLNPNLRGHAADAAMRRVFTETGRPQQTAEAKIREGVESVGEVGKIFENTASVTEAVNKNLGDVALNAKGVSDALQKMSDQRIGIPKATSQLLAIQNRFGENEPQFRMAQAMIDTLQARQQGQMAFMSPTQQFAAAVQNLNQVTQVKATTPEQQATQQQAAQQVQQTLTNQINTIRQQLLMQEQYDRQRRWSEQDFQQQREWGEQDYQLQRTRAEDAFNLQRKWATQDYYIQINRANQEYDIQRRRMEEDWNHQLQVNAEQQATTLYNIYQRVDAQQTSSATWLLSNAADQLQRMREQSSDLDRLRQMGLTNRAIQQLGLNDPKNQQQLASFVSQMTPQLIQQFNRVAGTARVAAAKRLIQDPSNLQFQEALYQHQKMLQRGEDDHQRMLDHSWDDFHRSMQHNDRQMDIQMSQMETDHNTMVSRMITQHDQAMNRMQISFNDSAKVITGNVNDILDMGVSKLQGYAGQAARQTKNTFDLLASNTNPGAIQVMQNLAAIFGFPWKMPTGLAGAGGGGLSQSQQPGTQPNKPGVQIEHHEGGVIPGYTPGRDTHQITVGGGEAIMRPEWTKWIGGKAAVDRINHDAIYGGFFGPGPEQYVPPKQQYAAGGVVAEGLSWMRRQVGKPYLWGGVGPGGYDCSGLQSALTNVMRGASNPYFRLGSTASMPWPGFAMGPGDYSVGWTDDYGGTGVGHTSATLGGVNVESSVDDPRGVKMGAGARSARDSHFTGLMHLIAAGRASGAELAALANFGGHAAFGDQPTAFDPFSLLKKRYKKAEAIARAMAPIHPLKPGQISEVVNRFARHKIMQLLSRYGTSFDGSGEVNIGGAPANAGNKQMVLAAARRIGWGDELSALNSLMMGESGYNNMAQNPTSSAFGMFQFLDSTWSTVGGHKTSDPWLQTKYGLTYIKQRYGDPANAWRLWQSRSPHWYGDGSVFTKPNVIGVGENGPEAVIPLNQRGGEFMGDVMARSIGMGATPVMGGSTHYHAVRIDKSNTFTGPITVCANDPAELITKLQAAQRLQALSRPQLTTTGVAA